MSGIKGTDYRNYRHMFFHESTPSGPLIIAHFRIRFRGDIRDKS